MAYSRRFRVWHWLNGIVLLGSLLTVVLRKTFLSSKKMAFILSAELSRVGIEVPEEKARGAARAIRDGMWQWHYWLGFTLVGLLCFRLLAGRAFPLRFKPKEAIHAAFYGVLSFMGISGLLMYFSGDLGLSAALVDEIQEVHEAGQWFFYGFVPLHLGAVIRAEVTKEPGLVSRMIHGR